MNNAWQPSALHNDPTNYLRLFIALPPPRELREQLFLLAQTCQTTHGGRSILAINLHLTLIFLGHTHKKFVPTILECIKHSWQTSFTLILEHIGYFKKGGILWIGPAICPALFLLQQELSSCLLAAQIDFDQHKFIPHITLLRKAQNLTEACSDISFSHLTWEVTSPVLYHSVHLNNTAHYVAL